MPSFSSACAYALPLLGLWSGVAASPASSLLARADSVPSLDTCDCGFVDNADSSRTVYTTYFRMDFTSSEWTRADLARQFRLSNSTIYKNATAPYARDFNPEQVQLTPQGLELIVSPPETLTNGSSVHCGGIYSKTDDFGFGSYHLTGKVAEPAGVVNAFFVYKNDTSEVDLEYVSRDAGNGRQFVRESVKPQIYEENGAASPLTYQRDIYTEDGSISDEFHDWAFMWSEDDVTFAVDGNYTNKVTRNIPQDRGLFAISAWSDGGPNYSQGPPTSNATFLVSQVWVLYNSTASPVPASNLNGDASKVTAMTCSARKTPCYVGSPKGSDNGLLSVKLGATSGALANVMSAKVAGVVGVASLFLGAMLV